MAMDCDRVTVRLGFCEKSHYPFFLLNDLDDCFCQLKTPPGLPGSMSIMLDPELEPDDLGFSELVVAFFESSQPTTAFTARRMVLVTSSGLGGGRGRHETQRSESRSRITRKTFMTTVSALVEIVAMCRQAS